VKVTFRGPTYYNYDFFNPAMHSEILLSSTQYKKFDAYASRSPQGWLVVLLTPGKLATYKKRLWSAAWLSSSVHLLFRIMECITIDAIQQIRNDDIIIA
jgi:hypothetical protein